MQMFTTLPLGEKIKQMRISKGVSQESVAQALCYSKATISRLEGGQTELSGETLDDIKKFLEIENAPLYEHELRAFRRRLLVANEYIDEDRISEAADALKELSVISIMPFEEDVYKLYNMVSIRLLLKEHKDSDAKELLDSAKLTPNASTEVQHLFYRNKGTAIIANDIWDRDKALSGLSYFQKANEVGPGDLKPDPALFVQLGSAYLRLCKPIRAVLNFEQALIAYGDKHCNIDYIIHCKIALADCLIFIHEFSRAKKLVDKVLEQTLNTQYKYYYGIALAQMGLILRKTGNPKEGLTYAMQSINYANDDGRLTQDHHTYLAIYGVLAEYLLDMKEYEGYNQLISEGKRIAQGHEAHTIAWEASGKLINLYDKNSIDYIENTAIPYLKSSKDIYLMANALNLCNKLIAHYKKRASSNKANAVAAIAYELFRDIVCGPDDIE